MKRLVLLILVWCCGGLAFGASYQAIVDSLEQVLAQTEDPDRRLSLISAMLENTLFQDVDVAEQYVVRFSEEAELFGLAEEIARSHNFRGMLAYVRGQKTEAISSYVRAIESYQQLNDVFMVGMMCNNIGSLYETTDTEKAIEYLIKARTAFQSIDTLVWVANVNYNIANQEVQLGRYEEAMGLYKLAIKQMTVLNDDSNLASCFSGVGKTKWRLGEADSAIFYYGRALAIVGDRNLVVDRAVAHSALCGLYTEQMDKKAAAEHCALSAKFADQYGGIKQKLSSAKYRYGFHKKFGEPEKALEQMERWKSLQDSLVKSENEQFLAEVMTKYETAEKEKQLAIQDLELKQNEQERNFYVALLSVFALLLMGAVIFTWNKIKTNKVLQNQKELIERALEEKELLLREIHHRVKNNLQIVSSLLSIQSRSIQDDAALEAVNESRNRVKSMALIHQNLYNEDNLTGIDMQDYIRKLGESLVSNYQVSGAKVDLVTDIDVLNLDVDTTIPLGLILNELLTNALKYAFPEGQGGMVKISLKEEQEQLLLRVQDDGVGYQADATRVEESTGFGMRMIKTFSKKLDAEFNIRNDSGTIVDIRIKNFKKAS